MKKIRYYCDKCKIEQEWELFRARVPVYTCDTTKAGRENCLSLYQVLKDESDARLAQLWKAQQV